jgi:amino acid adenylation domain-containing protein
LAHLLQHLLIEAAERDPEREAARFEGDSVTYRELDRWTNQLARTLIISGTRRGDRVAIYLHKSLESLVAIFGILKAGAVYVPLDPTAPPPRLAYILSDCGVATLITSTNMLSGVSEMAASGASIGQVILLSGGGERAQADVAGPRVIEWESVLSESPEPPPATGTIDQDLAYILYTSGSTGRPKGVMISHKNIFAFLNWCESEFRLTEHDKVTSHAPLHFDLSTFDIFATIRAGATVVLIPEKLSVFPVQLVRLLQDERITVTYLVPTILSMMVNYGNLVGHDLDSLRLVLFAGEVFPIKYLRKLVEAVPDPDYYNLYGPTETNVCTHYRVQKADLAPEHTEPVPIGVACENMEVLVVDSEGSLITEPGMEGELWVRGDCVAEGYWGDLEKTESVFVANPFQEHYRETVYRTGDIVKFAPDRRNLLYIGRRDHMVKSRGYRIELGEIEAAIYSHSHVREVAVVAIPDDMIGNRIKAFIVPISVNSIGLSDLEKHCRKQLAQYMIPEEFAIVESLPKTSTGKVDRPSLVQAAQRSIVLEEGMQP